MKIRRNYVPEKSLEEFCDENDIEIVIIERHKEYNTNLTRFYGTIEFNNISAEIGESSAIRSSLVVNAGTEEDVLNLLMAVLSEKEIFFEQGDMYGAIKRRTIRVPRLTKVYKDKL